MNFHNFISLLGWIWFFAMAGAFAIFIFAFLREREWRGLFRSILIFIPLFAVLQFLLVSNFQGRDSILLIFSLATAIIIFLIIRPARKTALIKITDSQSRVDERDAIFHRFYKLKPGTKEFAKYYENYPDKKEIDAKIRQLPDLGMPGSMSYHEIASLFQMATFDVIGKLNQDVESSPDPVGGEKIHTSPGEFTKRIKGFGRHLGADLIGITKLNPAYVYSHIGRSPGKWGSPIELDHANAIAIAVEMKHDMIRHAPDSAVTTESSYQYFEAAKVALILAKFISRLGYEARAHIDGNYRVMCVPISADAGLGELGRLGLLITPEYGPRIRLAIVTTNLPLVQDKPIRFGVQYFCSICKKCATHCPSNSIEFYDKKIVKGVEKWQSQQESCYRFWRKQGSDCSVCIDVCPYSNPDTLMHNIIRWTVQRNNFARQLVFLADRFFYGKRRKKVHRLPDWHKK